MDSNPIAAPRSSAVADVAPVITIESTETVPLAVSPAPGARPESAVVDRDVADARRVADAARRDPIAAPLWRPLLTVIDRQTPLVPVPIAADQLPPVATSSPSSDGEDSWTNAESTAANAVR
jgi:hypothetical protein